MPFSAAITGSSARRASAVWLTAASSAGPESAHARQLLLELYSLAVEVGAPRAFLLDHGRWRVRDETGIGELALGPGQLLPEPRDAFRQPGRFSRDVDEAGHRHQDPHLA